MRIDFIKCHGSGNDFPLIDARAMALEDEHWAMLARLMADRDGPVGGDGMLLLDTAEDAPFAMRMFNSDGSEAETCLNGLRCVARLGFERLGIDTATVALRTSTAEAARVAPIAPGVATIRTMAGPASTRVADVGLKVAADRIIDGPVPGLPNSRRFTAVAMPNPHLVSFVDAIDEAELVAIGDWCEAAPPLIPGRANISFALAAEGALFVRTYERGVGLTDSCGSAMAAAVHAAGLTGRVPFGREVRVRNRGGLVLGCAEADGMVTITGNATFLYDASVEVDLAAGKIAPPVIHARREDEVAAWREAITI